MGEERQKEAPCSLTLESPFCYGLELEEGTHFNINPHFY